LRSSNLRFAAKELKYAGDINDSAKMTVWLHQQMMKNLTANGGKLPADVTWQEHGGVSD